MGEEWGCSRCPSRRPRQGGRDAPCTFGDKGASRSQAHTASPDQRRNPGRNSGLFSWCCSEAGFRIWGREKRGRLVSVPGLCPELSPTPLRRANPTVRGGIGRALALLAGARERSADAQGGAQLDSSPPQLEYKCRDAFSLKKFESRAPRKGHGAGCVEKAVYGYAVLCGCTRHEWAPCRRERDAA